jgi:hypothetical protein
MPPKQVKPDPAQKDLTLSFVLKSAAAAGTQEPEGIDAELQEHNEARLALGFKFKNQKNARVACPLDPTHKPEVFLSKPPNQRLFWRCDTCVDVKKPQYKKLVGADNELEEDGFKTVDASRNGSANNAVTAERLASQGSFDLPSLKRCFESIEERLISIDNGIAELVDIVRKGEERADRLEASTAKLIASGERLADGIQRDRAAEDNARRAMPPPHFGLNIGARPEPRGVPAVYTVPPGSTVPGPFSLVPVPRRNTLIEDPGVGQLFDAIGPNEDPRKPGVFTFGCVPKRIRADPPEGQATSAGGANGGVMGHGAANDGSVGPQHERLQVDHSTEPQSITREPTSPSGY